MPDYGLYRLVVFGLLHGQLIENGFWFRDTAPGEILVFEQSLQILMQDWQAQVKELWLDVASSEYQLLQLSGSTMNPKFGPVHTVEFTNTFGAQTPLSLPSHDAGLISWRTGFGGRSMRGRTYLAGIPADDALHSHIEDPTLTRMVALATKHVNYWGAAGTSGVHQFGVYSHKIGDTHDPSLPTQLVYGQAGFHVVSEAIVREQVATQRHRKVGRGN